MNNPSNNSNPAPQREDGFYHVREFASDPEYTVAKWNHYRGAAGWTCSGRTRLEDSDLFEIGPRIPSPAERAPSLRWRVGGKVPLNVYEGDVPMFQCHTLEQAARVVDLLNTERAPAREVPPVSPQELLLAVIERIVGDDFCEDLDCRVAFQPETLTDTEKTAMAKLGLIYRIAHSNVTHHSCYRVHDDWRKAAEKLVADYLEGNHG